MPTAKCSLAELLEFSFNVNVLDSRFIEFGKIEPPSNKLQHVSPRETFVSKQKVYVFTYS